MILSGNYLKVSWSHIHCILKKEPGFGQRRMLLRIESKIHVIIRVFLGAMECLLSVLHCVLGKWE